MDEQLEVWTILTKNEDNEVWNKFCDKFKFKLECANENEFKFSVPVDMYDISESRLYTEDDNLNEIIRQCFIKCMDKDNFMYVLDWQHTCFRYNPRIEDEFEYPVTIEDDPDYPSGYNVYFPKYYPDGDYYFFIAKDFSWGYLTHPWLREAYVFGEPIKNIIKENALELGFKKINSIDSNKN